MSLVHNCFIGSYCQSFRSTLTLQPWKYLRSTEYINEGISRSETNYIFSNNIEAFPRSVLDCDIARPWATRKCPRPEACVYSDIQVNGDDFVIEAYAYDVGHCTN